MSATVALEKLAAWKEALASLPESERNAQTYERLEQERDAFVHDESTGFVWLFAGK